MIKIELAPEITTALEHLRPEKNDRSGLGVVLAEVGFPDRHRGEVLRPAGEVGVLGGNREGFGVGHRGGDGGGGGEGGEFGFSGHGFVGCVDDYA